MRIATYNAASIRARLPLLINWLQANQPDILAIQETKVEDEKFPRAEIEELGYHMQAHGQKSWNGVATLSKLPITRFRHGFGDEFMPDDCRILATEIAGITVVNTYVPNGNTVGSDKFAYKLQWLERFAKLLERPVKAGVPLLWLGDINIAPTPLDVYDSPRFLGGVGHHPDEFVRLKAIVDLGLHDLYRQFHPNDRAYTFWDFVIPNGVARNLGWRIDHIYATAALAERCIGCEIDFEARSLPKPSDHTFVTAIFKE